MTIEKEAVYRLGHGGQGSQAPVRLDPEPQRPLAPIQVICRQPNGLILHLHNADRHGEAVTLQGGGEVNEVPAAFWDAWKALPQNSRFIESGLLVECKAVTPSEEPADA